MSWRWFVCGGVVMGRYRETEDEAYDRFRDEKPMEHAQRFGKIIDGAIKVGDPFHVPGRGKGTVTNFFGFTENRELKTFVNVKLESGEQVCLQVHDISRSKKP